MGCLVHQINQAKYILEGSQEIEDFMRVIAELKMPMSVGYANQKYPINQKILNAMLRYRLEDLGWKCKGVLLAPGRSDLKIGQKGDFSRTLGNGLRIFVEVEFGNIASIFRDFFKFSFVRDIDTYDLGILVVPSDSISKEIEGCYSFQAVQRILNHTRGSIQTPLLVLGIDPSREEDVDCTLLEPEWGREQWRNQSEPFWDDFVKKHADSLF